MADELWIIKGQDAPGDSSVTAQPRFKPGKGLTAHLPQPDLVV